MVETNGDEDEGARRFSPVSVAASVAIAGAHKLLALRLAELLVGKVGDTEIGAVFDDVLRELKNAPIPSFGMEDEAVGMGEAIEAVEQTFAQIARKFREDDE
ncbi:MAG: hypothetical protein ACK4MV_16335 [Beijerinckiaceae bacterium]